MTLTILAFHQNPDCSADKNTYCPITYFSQSKNKTLQNTRCDYCGVDTTRCSKMCYRDNAISTVRKCSEDLI